MIRLPLPEALPAREWRVLWASYDHRIFRDSETRIGPSETAIPGGDSPPLPVIGDRALFLGTQSGTQRLGWVRESDHLIAFTQAIPGSELLLALKRHATWTLISFPHLPSISSVGTWIPGIPIRTATGCWTDRRSPVEPIPWRSTPTKTACRTAGNLLTVSTQPRMTHTSILIRTSSATPRNGPMGPIRCIGYRR